MPFLCVTLVNIIILGGRDLNGWSTVEVQYDGTTWTPIGSLLNPRAYHRSIVIDNFIMHIGGYPGFQ